MTKQRRFNPDWPSAQADTKEARAERKRAQRQRERDYLASIGFSSAEALITALMRGEYVLVQKESAE